MPRLSFDGYKHRIGITREDRRRLDGYTEIAQTPRRFCEPAVQALLDAGIELGVPPDTQVHSLPEWSTNRLKVTLTRRYDVKVGGHYSTAQLAAVLHNSLALLPYPAPNGHAMYPHLPDGIRDVKYGLLLSLPRSAMRALRVRAHLARRGFESYLHERLVELMRADLGAAGGVAPANPHADDGAWSEGRESVTVVLSPAAWELYGRFCDAWSKWKIEPDALLAKKLAESANGGT